MTASKTQRPKERKDDEQASKQASHNERHNIIAKRAAVATRAPEAKFSFLNDEESLMTEAKQSTKYFLRYVTKILGLPCNSLAAEGNARIYNKKPTTGGE